MNLMIYMAMIASLLLLLFPLKGSESSTHSGDTASAMREISEPAAISIMERD